MGRNSAYAIHKQLEKEKYLATELGKLETTIKRFLENPEKQKKVTPADIARINLLRDEHEKFQMEHVKAASDEIRAINERHAKETDDSLVAHMKRELAILEEIDARV